MSTDDGRTKTGEYRRKRVESSVIIDSHKLLGDQQRVIIKHKGENYYLRVTRQDKLILTK